MGRQTDRQTLNLPGNRTRSSYLHQVFIDPFSEGFLLDSVPFICEEKTKAALGQCFSCTNSNEGKRHRGAAAGARAAGQILLPYGNRGCSPRVRGTGLRWEPEPGCAQAQSRAGEAYCQLILPCIFGSLDCWDLGLISIAQLSPSRAGDSQHCPQGPTRGGLRCPKPYIQAAGLLLGGVGALSQHRPAAGSSVLLCWGTKPHEKQSKGGKRAPNGAVLPEGPPGSPPPRTAQHNLTASPDQRGLPSLRA